MATINKYYSKLKHIVKNKNGCVINCDYKNYNSLVTIKCAYGHYWQTKCCNIFYNKWCPECYRLNGTTKISSNEVLAKYEELGSYSKVADTLGTSVGTVHNKLKKIGKNNPIMYSDVNHFAFSCNSPESFYWAGFLAADGCVTKAEGKYKTLTVGLARKDISMLYYLKDFLQFTGKVYEYNKRCSISIRSDNIFDDLSSRFNITERKSLVYFIPKWISEHQNISHFIRGYFDGDGSIMLVGGKKIAISIVGTYDCIKTIHDIIRDECNLGYDKKITKNANMYSVRYCGNILCKKIHNFMYRDSNHNTRLERKYKKILEV